MDMGSAYAAFSGAFSAFALAWGLEGFRRVQSRKLALRLAQLHIGQQIQKSGALYHNFFEPHEESLPSRRCFDIPPMGSISSPAVNMENLDFIASTSWQRRSGSVYGTLLHNLFLSQWTYEIFFTGVADRSRVHHELQHRVAGRHPDQSDRRYYELESIQPQAAQLLDVTEELYRTWPRLNQQLRDSFEELGEVLRTVYHEAPIRLSDPPVDDVGSEDASTTKSK